MKRKEEQDVCVHKVHINLRVNHAEHLKQCTTNRKTKNVMIEQGNPRARNDVNEAFSEVWGVLSTPPALKSLQAIERSTVEPSCKYINGKTAGYLDVHLPGVATGDISVRVDGNEKTLTIKGRRVKTITIGKGSGKNEVADPELARVLKRAKKEYMKPGHRVHVVTKVYKKMLYLDNLSIVVEGIEIDDYRDGVLRIRIPFRTVEPVSVQL